MKFPVFLLVYLASPAVLLKREWTQPGQTSIDTLSQAQAVKWHMDTTGSLHQCPEICQR